MHVRIQVIQAMVSVFILNYNFLMYINAQYKNTNNFLVVSNYK